MMNKGEKYIVYCLILAVIFFVLFYVVLPRVFSVSLLEIPRVVQQVLPSKEKEEVLHIPPPDAVKSIYMTALVAGSKNPRNRVVKIIDDTEINALVIDIKDYTGRISYPVTDPYLVQIGSQKAVAPDMKAFIKSLHEKGIYVIGRVAVFQDPYLVKIHPEYAVKTKSGEVWKDHKGISWIDAGTEEAWKYAVAIAKDAHSIGFDEINFDYIRFPSDGNMKDITYPFSEGKLKKDVMRSFYEYVNKELSGTGIFTSADLFGMTTTNKDDLNIGQILEDALRNFDYVAPMVYPSHYPDTFLGYKNPADHPYEVIQYSMSHAVTKATMASTSPLKLRPWLQDFNYKAVYTPAMVRDQIKATYDVGLTSWMLWDPSNYYTREALEKEPALTQ